MQTRDTRRRRRSRGMTLIEIMVVITLLGIIAAAVGVAAVNMLERGQIDSARTQAHEIAKSLDSYRVLFGRYPSTSEGLSALVSPPNNGKPIMERMPKDPWNNEYQYLFPGTHNTSKFDVKSFGPDGQEGGGDDIGNWPAEEN
jgi:general secretion pathway protein G